MRERLVRRRRLLARLCLAWAVLSLVSELTPLGYWLFAALPAYWDTVTWLAATPSIGFAVLLGVLSAGLRRGRVAAFWLFAACLALAGPLGWLAAAAAGGWLSYWQVPTWFWIAVGIHLALLAGVACQWRAFRIPGERVGLRRLLRLIPLAALAVLLGLGAVAATDTGGASGPQRAVYVLQRAVADTGLWPVTNATVRVPWGVDLLINLIAGLLVAAGLYLLLRSPRHVPARTEAEESQLRGLIAGHGARDSLSYFALRRDKNVIFSPTGKAAVSYRVLGGVSVAAGDPLGDPEAWPGAITAWREQAEQHGWRCAVLGASEQGAIAYQRLVGLHALALGDEAVIEVDQFDLNGRPMRGVRQAHARVTRAGYTATAARQGELDADTLGAITRAAARWRESPERGFSMALGRIGDQADPDYLLLQCRDRDDQLRAVLGFAPWGREGLSLDLMIRDRQADNGLIEYLVAELIAQAPGLEVARLSLNFAMFREVFALGERIGAGPVLRIHRRLLLVASRWWQLESLYRANVKYQPSWVPRHLCYAALGDLAPVLVAAGRAEGFLP